MLFYWTIFSLKRNFPCISIFGLKQFFLYFYEGFYYDKKGWILSFSVFFEGLKLKFYGFHLVLEFDEFVWESWGIFGSFWAVKMGLRLAKSWAFGGKLRSFKKLQFSNGKAIKISWKPPTNPFQITPIKTL